MGTTIENCKPTARVLLVGAVLAGVRPSAPKKNNQRRKKNRQRQLKGGQATYCWAAGNEMIDNEDDACIKKKKIRRFDYCFIFIFHFSLFGC